MTKHQPVKTNGPFPLKDFFQLQSGHSISVTSVFKVVKTVSSRKHLRTKVTPDFHLTYSKNGEIWGRSQNDNKNSAEVNIAPAFGEITTACNVGQAKKGHGACLKSGQLVYAKF